jgi:hypothetical protein
VKANDEELKKKSEKMGARKKEKKRYFNILYEMFDFYWNFILKGSKQMLRRFLRLSKLLHEFYESKMQCKENVKSSF